MCHIFSILVVYLSSIYMMKHTEKTIDEKIQGKALVTVKKAGNTKKLFIESYGCQMNMNDSEIVASILDKEGYNTTQILEEADLVLVNTCSIREKAETTVRRRLQKYNAVKKVNPTMKVGVLGCMAERLKEKFLEEEKIVDLVVGPDAYRDLPNLLTEVNEGRDAINVILSKEETYGDVSPVRLNSNGVSAFVSITRGCDNMCTFCVVPFTRGRERSRDPKSILEEIQSMVDQNFKEITLLGQNVDSFLWFGGGLKKDFKKASEMAQATAVDFSQLLDMCATEFPKTRFRFSTSNPQDMSLDVIYTMAKHENICKYIHLPVQSGSTAVLQRMNRQHTREEYIELIDNIRRILPDCSISQDMMTGFCGETEEEHKNTLSLMDLVEFDFAFMYKYSETLGVDIKNYITKYFSFGNFEFWDPTQMKVLAIAKDLNEFQKALQIVTEDCLVYHAKRSEFSKWLKSRALFSLANLFSNVEYEEFDDAEQIREFLINAIKLCC